MENQEITIIDLVASLETTSGLALETGVQELNGLVERSKTIESADDPKLKEIKKEMVTKRNYIKNYCLDARREIKKRAEGVSEVESMLLDIFVGEENRLDEIIETARKTKEREERVALLPQRIARLQAIWGEGQQIGATEEELLEMDGATFEGLINRMNAEKLDADRAEIARQQAEIDRKNAEMAAEQKRLDDAKKAAEDVEKARIEERQQAAQREADAKKAESDRIECEATEKIQNRKRELMILGMMPNTDTNSFNGFGMSISLESVNHSSSDDWAVLFEKAKVAKNEKIAEAVAAKEKEDREADEKYNAWLVSIGCVGEDAELFHLIADGNEISAYKLISKFTTN